MAVLDGKLEVFANDQSLAYPSANAINGGELNSEENIRNIVTRVSTKSFVIKRLPNADDTDGTDISNDSETFGLSIGTGGSSLVIAPGECNIRGYYFRCKIQTSLVFTDYIGTDPFFTDIYNNWNNYVTEGNVLRLYVYLNVMKDSSDHILAYDSNESLSYTKFRGVVVTFTNELKSTYDLLLGDMSISKNEGAPGFTINEVNNNENRFTFLDANDIFYYDIDSQDILNLEQLIIKQIRLNASGNIHDNLTVFGPTTNPTNTTNVFLTTNNAEKIFRIYYNYSTNEGGLAIYSGSLDSEGNIVVGNLIKNLLTFTDLPVSVSQIVDTLLTIGVATTFTDNVTFNNNIDVSGNANVYGDMQVGSTTSSSTINLYGNINIIPTSPDNHGTLITESQVKSDKVYGAVWG